MSSKVCSKCKEEKDAGAFSKDSRSKDGLQYVCRKCCTAYNKTAPARNAVAVYRDSDKGRYAQSKACAKSRGLEFSFTFEEYVEKITESNFCHYCGRTEKECNDLSDFVQNYEGNDPKVLKLKINLGGHAHSSKHFSIDRLDSFDSYYNENCVLCCSFCNQAKGWMISSAGYESIAKSEVNNLINTCINAGFNKEA